ncbi:MAG: hypothetical protein PHH26_00150 [Candidatus Thermoplasmatota archaeon]|nr:hypothetical protein [Candidatus Thermoplasmatota archaeon]
MKAQLKFTASLFLAVMLLAPAIQFADATEVQSIQVERRIVTVYAPAVGQLANGTMVGSLSTIQITVQSNGSGMVFVDTMPLTEIDMQGSARLAVNVACSVTGKNCSNYDFYFVVRSQSQVIGGPSAGGVMCTGVIAALEDWEIYNHTMMTGMINPDGSIGPIGGIPYKAQAVAEAGASRFLIPYGQGNITEMVTETYVQGGMVIQRTVPKEINIIEYAKSKWNLDVVEIRDIYDAVYWMTGHDAKKNASQNPVTSEKYTAIMKDLAESLMERANESFSNATGAFNGFPNTMHSKQYKSEVQSYYNYASDALNASIDSYNIGEYYTTSSKCFQASWYSRFVVYASGFFENDSFSYVSGIIENSSETVGTIMENVLNHSKNITSIEQLEAFGGAQQRIFEANESAGSAKRVLDNPMPTYDACLSSIGDASYAVERAESATWWMEIGQKFAGNSTLNETKIMSASEEYVQSASEIIAYATALQIDVSGAQDLVSKAENALDLGLLPLGLFYAIEGYADATNSVETFGYDSIPAWKIEKASEVANSYIDESRSLGVEPVLAVSYYEFAKSLYAQDPSANSASALLYMKYSAMIAKLSGFILNANAETAQWETIKVGTGREIYVTEAPAYVTWIYAAIIFAAGLGLGFSAVVLFAGKQTRKGTRRRAK